MPHSLALSRCLYCERAALVRRRMSYAAVPSVSIPATHVVRGEILLAAYCSLTFHISPSRSYLMAARRMKPVCFTTYGDAMRPDNGCELSVLTVHFEQV